MEHPFLPSPTVLFLLRSLLRAQIPFLYIFHYLFRRLITLFLGLCCNQLRMLFDLSPSSSSSKMPSSSLSSSSTPIFSSYPYSPPSSSPKSPSSSSVIFLPQRPLHRLRRRLSFIIPILSPSSLSTSSSPSSYIILLHSRVFHHYPSDISTIVWGYSLSPLRVKPNALIHR